jgi:hypothetical protein
MFREDIVRPVYEGLGGQGAERCDWGEAFCPSSPTSWPFLSLETPPTSPRHSLFRGVWSPKPFS